MKFLVIDKLNKTSGGIPGVEENDFEADIFWAGVHNKIFSKLKFGLEVWVRFSMEREFALGAVEFEVDGEGFWFWGEGREDRDITNFFSF